MTDTLSTSNIYLPGLSRLDLPEKHPDHRNVYTDKEVALLPSLNSSHPRYREWIGRKASSHRLVRYLTLHQRAASILEIGCGNGWLCHQLSTVPGSRVVGLDLNLNELRQAARVFRQQPNLKFIYGDFYSTVLQDLSFDVIVMAATIHHFPSPHQTIKDALAYLRPRGELHLLDSVLYRPVLQDFPHRYRYNPGSFWNRLRHSGGHPWVIIRP